MGGGKNLDRLRVFGVLQRFGICYFVTASVFILFSTAKQFQEEKVLDKIFSEYFY